MSGQQHRHESCRDRGCERPYCVIWREGKREGYEDGRADFYQPRYDEGYADARADFYQPRYDEGFADGLAAGKSS